MNMESINIGVLCYYFPPHKSVGGRRWAKFSKFLNERKIPITVFSESITRFPDSELGEHFKPKYPEWFELVHLDSGFPTVLARNPQTIREKLLYRISKFKLKRSTTSNIYDPSLFWDKVINQIAQYIQDKKINVLIVSGAPFAYMYYALKLKNRFPNLKLIADFRDLWVDSKLGYGEYVKDYQGEDRFLIEYSRQQAVLDSYERIVVVSDDIKAELNKSHSLNEKIFVIPNGFDPDDGFCNSEVSPQSETVSFLYIGTINCEESYFNSFLQALRQMAADQEALFKKMKFYFVGNENKNFSLKLDELGFSNIEQLPRKSLNDLLEFSVQIDFLLYFKMRDSLANSFGTKFYDYLRLRRPMLVLSPLGKVTEYVQEKRLGIVMSPESIYEVLKDVASFPKRAYQNFDSNQNFPEFDLRSISLKYLDLIENL